ncbi:response regulator [candidate division KSB1 bacterium]|nr:response regulator [candidate division KSB1 bacterium]NIR68479.1 response regulator [candidate division KSB1 bacterium]NIS22493.1 response regulator [candidate division KSB1 bacterium]NIT69337.1 response regulator [candidate division KSB1 bacterium]NIU22998.1 response regulator [candidate division KSB1 bacterium]
MRGTILIVENDRGLRQLYQTALRQLGYDVLIAANGGMALEKLKSNSVDLIILALELSDGSGLQHLCKFMDVQRQAKVVINAGHTMAKWDFRSWAADAFLIKSTDLTELKNTVDTLLERELNVQSLPCSTSK